MDKKILLCIMILICACSIVHVSATDNLDNVTSTESSDTLDQVNETENLDTSPGSYSDLDALFYDYYQVELDRDYEYDPQKDSDFHSGVLIGHELSVDGKNHTIYGNGARFLHIASVSNVYITNLNFVNIYSPDFRESYDGNCFYYGGGIVNEGTLYLENCTFINNYALVLGGAVLSTDDSTLHVTNCEFLNNSVSDENGIDDDYEPNGGAICSFGQLSVLTSTFKDGSAYEGGAIAAFFDTYVWYSNFTNCRAIYRGGAIYNHKQNASDIYNCTFKANEAAYGGALYNTIATKCYFHQDNYAATKKGHNMNGGVNIDCESEKESSENYYEVIFSESFIIDPVSLVINKTDDAKLEILVKSKPNGEPVPGVWLNLRLEDESGDYNYYLLKSDEKGIADMPVSSFENGTYKITVTFVNKAYNDNEFNYNLILGKVKSKVTFSASIVFEYGKVGKIFVDVNGGTLEEKNIQVVNHREAKISLQGSMVSISGLKVGTYVLRVTSTPDENHTAGTGEISITVNKAIAVIKASKLTVALKKGTIWTIKLVDSKTNKPIANMELTLKVFTGKKYRIVRGITNSKGELKYKTSGLSKGTHKVVVSATHSGYKFNTLTSSIKVIKPKALVFKLRKRVNDKDGSLISYVVKDKKTKKGINGVKIKLYIYTGKKYKVITLKTKKSGKFKGAMGFATNDLSVGKHKVIIKPASIKYSGSAKTTMIIKKTAKKRQTYSHKL